MAGFQQAANTITSAPARFNVQKSIVDVLKTELAGEKATTAAYEGIQKMTATLARGETPTKEELKGLGEIVKNVPVENREKFMASIEDMKAIGKQQALNEYRIANLRDRIRERETELSIRKGIPTAIRTIANQNALNRYEEEEMKSGTTQTSR